MKKAIGVYLAIGLAWAMRGALDVLHLPSLWHGKIAKGLSLWGRVTALIIGILLASVVWPVGFIVSVFLSINKI